MKKSKEIALIVFTVLVFFTGAFGVYAGTYYRADEWAKDCLLSADAVHVVKEGENYVFMPQEKPACGFIFYPGGKVEYTAYAPLMYECAERGILCILVQMPANLAVLNIHAADGIKEKYPSVTKWLIGGHSLGGAMAASYVSEKEKEYSGLVLLGAYSIKDLTKTNLSVLCLYGSEDRVMNKGNYNKNRKKLPVKSTEKIIEGGCHAYFGSYGKQKGDGTPKISCRQQTAYAAELIASFCYSAIS